MNGSDVEVRSEKKGIRRGGGGGAGPALCATLMLKGLLRNAFGQKNSPCFGFALHLR
jgi:hypothetical protein